MREEFDNQLTPQLEINATRESKSVYDYDTGVLTFQPEIHVIPTEFGVIHNRTKYITDINLQSFHADDLIRLEEDGSVGINDKLWMFGGVDVKRKGEMIEARHIEHGKKVMQMKNNVTINFTSKFDSAEYGLFFEDGFILEQVDSLEIIKDSQNSKLTYIVLDAEDVDFDGKYLSI